MTAPRAARRLALLGLVSTLAAGRAAAQTDVAPLPTPPTPPPLSDGPGDEEAKADFQQTRVLPDLSPLTVSGRSGALGVYGFGALDALFDSTRSFGPGTNNFSLAREGSPPSEQGQSQLTICDSRLGARVSTSAERRSRGFFLIELGPEFRRYDPADSGLHCGLAHLRHLYLAAHTPIVDVLVGRTYALFGWGGKGLLPNTAAFMGVAGQLYALERQVRLSHIFRFEPLDFELAGALAGSSPDGNTGWTSLEFGVRFAVNRVRGASAQAGGPPVAAPLQIGLSLVGRAIAANDFVRAPADPVFVDGGGLAFDLFAPLIPAHGDDLGNALSLTLELTAGSGLADLYTGLTGGVKFPALPNPANVVPPPVYTPGIQDGIVSYDAGGNLRTINWRTFVLGAQYHLPFARGRRVWISALYTGTHSNNAETLTPMNGLYFIWNDGRYLDASVFVGVTRAFQLAASVQATRQQLADYFYGRNLRAQLAAAYFF